MPSFFRKIVGLVSKVFVSTLNYLKFQSKFTKQNSCSDSYATSDFKSILSLRDFESINSSYRQSSTSCYNGRYKSKRSCKSFVPDDSSEDDLTYKTVRSTSESSAGKYETCEELSNITQKVKKYTTKSKDKLKPEKSTASVTVDNKEKPFAIINFYSSDIDISSTNPGNLYIIV